MSIPLYSYSFWQPLLFVLESFETRYQWGVAKWLRQRPLEPLFEGSNPSAPAKILTVNLVRPDVKCMPSPSSRVTMRTGLAFLH